MLITALVRTRILIQGENGYSVFAGGGYMRTVSTMKILIVMAKLCPPLLSIILSILLFNNIKTYVSKICA